MKEMHQKTKKDRYIHYVKHVAVPCLFYGTIVGLIVGSIVYGFRLATAYIVDSSNVIFAFVKANPAFIPVLLIGLFGLGALEALIQKWAPETAGMNLPRAEGAIRGILPLRWLRTTFGIIANSFISFFAGLPLGSEGPSVLLGTSLANGANDLPLSHIAWRKYIMTGGACAGFTVATGAPLTGILFGLEESHKRFTPAIALMSMFSVVSAYLTTELWALLSGREIEPWIGIASHANGGAGLGAFSIGDVGFVALLGVAIGLVSCLFNYCIFKSGQHFDSKLARIPRWLKLSITFVVVGVVGIFLVDAIYSGHDLIDLIAENHYETGKLVLIFVVKFLLVVLCCSVNATGDLCLPMFAFGALIGGVMSKLFVAMGMDSSLVALVVLIGMSSFMGACTRTPITAIVWVVECSWSFTNLFYVAIAVFLSAFVAELSRIDPLYDVILDRMVEHHHEGKHADIVKLKYTVTDGSFAAHKTVRDILWPANAIVGDIARHGEHQMDAGGEKKLLSGDIVTIQAETYDIDETMEELSEIMGNQEAELEYIYKH
jgi:H+/Cl- antiporter ClcA